MHAGERLIGLSHRRLQEKSGRSRALDFGHEAHQPADSARETYVFSRREESRREGSAVDGESSPENGTSLEGPSVTPRGTCMYRRGNRGDGILRDEQRRVLNHIGAFRPASAPPVRTVGARGCARMHESILV